MRTYIQNTTTAILITTLLSACGGSGRGIKSDAQTATHPPAFGKVIIDKDGSSISTTLNTKQIVLPDSAEAYFQASATSALKRLFSPGEKTDSFNFDGIDYFFAPDTFKLENRDQGMEPMPPNTKWLAELSLGSKAHLFKFKLNQPEVGKIDLVQIQHTTEFMENGKIRTSKAELRKTLAQKLKVLVNHSRNSIVFYMDTTGEELNVLRHQFEPNIAEPESFHHPLCKKIHVNEWPIAGTPESLDQNSIRLSEQDLDCDAEAGTCNSPFTFASNDRVSIAEFLKYKNVSCTEFYRPAPVVRTETVGLRIQIPNTQKSIQLIPGRAEESSNTELLYQTLNLPNEIIRFQR